jgi:hypothetical protein
MMGSAIDRLRVHLAKVDVDPYIARRGEKIVPVIRHERGLPIGFEALLQAQIPGQTQFKGLATPKPRKRRRSKNAPEIAEPDPVSLFHTIADGEERYKETDLKLGGSAINPPVFPLERLKADEVKESERHQSELAINRFMKNKAMQPFFNRFGRPTFVIANGTPEGDDPMHVEDPGGRGEAAAMAAWRAGVVYVYAPSAGNPAFLKGQHVPIRGKEPEVSTGPSGFSPMGGEVDTVMQWGGRDAILRHEYGHQVMFLAFDDARSDGESDAFGGKGGQAVLDGFFQTVFGRSSKEVQTEIEEQEKEKENKSLGLPSESGMPDDLGDSIEAALGPLSTYAVAGGLHEAAAEAFAVVTDPHYSRKTSPYPPATQKVLDYVEDLVK